MTKRFNSVGMVAFTVEHDSHDPSETPVNQLRAALMRRIADLDSEGDLAWPEAIAFDDTYDQGAPPPALTTAVNGDDTYYMGFAHSVCVRHCREPGSPSLFGETIRHSWKVGFHIETQTESFFDFFAEFRKEPAAHSFAKLYAQRGLKESS